MSASPQSLATVYRLESLSVSPAYGRLLSTADAPTAESTPNSWNKVLLGGSSALAMATWGVQELGYHYASKAPALVETVANSGGHPLFGVVGAVLGQQIERFKEKGNALKAAAMGLAATVMIDVAAEQTQDMLLYAHKPPFYSAERIGENFTDLKFALGGFAVAALVNNWQRLPFVGREQDS
jgi:hypothetical protein